MRRIYRKNIVFKTKFMATLALSTSVFVFATSAYALDIGNPYNSTITGEMSGTADADNMFNAGIVTGYFIGYHLNDIIINYGTVNGSIDGDDIWMEVEDSGDDTITNYGTVGQNIYGRNGNDTIINSGTVEGYITGNEGDDTITNSGTVKVNIWGYAGNDIITNEITGHVVGRISGEADDDTILNYGTVDDIIYGGSGNDNITNFGVAVTTINGADGNDIITNEATGIVGEDIYGGTGNDIINNYGTVNDGIYGGDEHDTIINSGRVSGSVYGGNNNDIITNSDFIYSTIYGQDGDDTITNYGTVSGYVDGDDTWTVGVTGDDTITNFGTVAGSISGRAGEDIIINEGTGIVDLGLYGDDDNDQINNKGNVKSSIGGGAGNDIVVNSGFAQNIYGGDGDDVITNSGVVGIDLSGGDGTDVLYLSGSASVGGEVRYFETVNVTGAGTKTVGTLILTPTTSTTIEAYSPGTIISVTGSADLGVSNALTVDFVGVGQAGKYYLIDTADSLTGTFTGITTSNLSDTLKVIYEYTSGDLIAKVLLESYQDGAGGEPVLSETAQQISSVLDGVAPTATGDMETIIDTLNAASGSEQELANRIEQLSPEMHSFSSQITGSASGTLTSFSQMRMASIRDGAVANTKIASKYSFDPNDPSSWPKIAYSGDDFNSLFNHSKDRFGFFMQTMVQKSRQDAYDNNLGYTSTSWYTAGGMDYEFTDDFLAGISLGYARTKVKFTDQGNSMSTADNYQFGAYGSYHPEGGLSLTERHRLML